MIQVKIKAKPFFEFSQLLRYTIAISSAHLPPTPLTCTPGPLAKQEILWVY